MRIRILLALLAFVLVSCTPKTPETQTSTTTTETHTVKVNRVDLGREMTADRRVVTWGTAFAPADTVFASVALTGPTTPTQVTARWVTADGQLVEETTETVTAGDTETATMFYLVKPAGLPPGNYKLEIVSDGVVVSTREFMIEAPPRTP
jgi:hypothetical protein